MAAQGPKRWLRKPAGTCAGPFCHTDPQGAGDPQPERGSRHTALQPSAGAASPTAPGSNGRAVPGHVATQTVPTGLCHGHLHPAALRRGAGLSGSVGRLLELGAPSLRPDRSTSCSPCAGLLTAVPTSHGHPRPLPDPRRSCRPSSGSAGRRDPSAVQGGSTGTASSAGTGWDGASFPGPGSQAGQGLPSTTCSAEPRLTAPGTSWGLQQQPQPGTHPGPALALPPQPGVGARRL